MTPFERSIHTPPIWFLIPAVLIGVVAVSIIGYVIWAIVTTNARNRRAPLLEREALVVSRRQHVWGDNASTHYYVTFEFSDGHREELQLSPQEYGMVAEGDSGLLQSQGTWFRSFSRRTGR